MILTIGKLFLYRKIIANAFLLAMIFTKEKLFPSFRLVNILLTDNKTKIFLFLYYTILKKMNQHIY